jgi:hypothetical protein
MNALLTLRCEECVDAEGGLHALKPAQREHLRQGAAIDDVK